MVLRKAGNQCVVTEVYVMDSKAGSWPQPPRDRPDQAGQLSLFPCPPLSSPPNCLCTAPGDTACQQSLYVPNSHSQETKPAWPTLTQVSTLFQLWPEGTAGSFVINKAGGAYALGPGQFLDKVEICCTGTPKGIWNNLWWEVLYMLVNLPPGKHCYNSPTQILSLELCANYFIGKYIAYPFYIWREFCA